MKGRIKADPINVNNFSLKIDGVFEVFPVEVTGIEKENPKIDLPDFTTAPGGRTKSGEFVVKIPAHHKLEVVYMNAWAKMAEGKQLPTAKVPCVYKMKSGTENNSLTAALEGVWCSKTKLPDGEMKNEGEMAILEYTCYFDNVEFI